MKGRKLIYAFLLLLLVGVGITSAKDGKKYLSSQKEFYLTPAELAFIRPGLNLKIQSVEVSGSTVSATLRITDDQGQPLDRLGIETPGEVSISWILARINPGDTQYTAYTTRTRTNQVTGEPVIQGTTEKTGTYSDLGDGVYKYTFATQLPSGYPADATHTVGVQATRDLRTLAEQLGLFQLVKTGRYDANDTFDFVPSGGEVTVVRDVVRTEACNQCHNPLAIHGGGARRITQLCILCHQPQSTDDVTGNTVDFKVMIHKIHRGKDLPSVKAGTPYRIEDGDFSDVEFPQDLRYCTTCHQQGTQSDNYKTNPNRAACGSCHDDVNFATGKNHPGGIQADDSLCTICHAADTGLEFDLSVTGVHTIPANSKQLAGINLEILEVTNTKPGDHPTVSFTVKDNAGNPLDISNFDRIRLTLGGPTSDYTFGLRENVQTATPGPSGYTYTFNAAIPADATGTFAVGAEAFNQTTIPGPLLGQNFSVREAALTNPIFYFGISGGPVVPRRQVVSLDNCNKCHNKLALHGTARRNTELCVICHNPRSSDAAGRPADQLPGRTLDFRTLIHHIHTGEDLENDFTIFDEGNPENFNEVAFPGDRRDCSTCHVNDSYELPLPDGLLSVDTPRNFFTPTGPTAAACLGCHDAKDAAAHAFVMTAPFGESCPACHEEGADFAVSRVHAR